MKKMLRWTLGALAAAVLLVAAVGWMLPVAHVASRTAIVDAPPDAVFDIVRDVAAYPRWRPDVTRVELDHAGEGPLRYREISGGDVLTMEMTEAVRPGRVVTRIADPSLPFGGTWTFEIAPADAGSRVTITERGEVYNPIFRFASRFVIGHYRTIDRYIANLRAYAASQSGRDHR